MGLPQTPIVCSYNGVNFPANTDTVECSIKPIPDASGRAVQYVQYAITLKAILGEDNQALSQTTDTTMATLRKRLTAYAGALRYENVGMGALSINVGGPKDVVWGPKPTLLRYKPLGQVAAEITWSVEVGIPECDVATYQFALMEFVFKLGIDIDQSGYTRRTFAGHLKIPQTRTGVDVRTLTDQADRYRENINPALVSGFRRIPGRFILSEDKCRLDFEVVDEEMPPNYPPEWVIDVQASHTISSKGAIPSRWFATLSATYEMARDAPKQKALAHFWNLFLDRFGQTNRSGTRLPDGRVVNATPIPVTWQMSEPEIYGRRCASFSMTYTFVSSLADILTTSALWRPVPFNDWSRWATSLAPGPWHARGNAKMAFDNNVDAIIDLCLPAQAALLQNQLPPEPPGEQGTTPPPTQVPPPETSWLIWESRLRWEQEDDTLMLKKLPPNDVQLLRTLPPSYPPPADPLPQPPPGDDGQRTSDTGGLEFRRVGHLDVYPPASDDRVSQVRSNPDYKVRLVGYAVRAGYPIGPPALIEVGGAHAIPQNPPGSGFEQWVMDEWFGLPIHACRWNLLYTLSKRPEGMLPVMDTPWS